MARNMRDEILKTAKDMFLNNAYDAVAMRDIAKALNISVGNLTYYFKKKDNLVEAVILDMFTRYEPRPPCRTLEELDARIVVFEKAGDEDTFYFKDFASLSQIGEKVQHIQKEVFEGNMRFWRETLQALCTAGIIEAEGFNGQHDAFIHNFYLVKARWSEQTVIEAGLGAREMSFRLRAWASIFPMLTDLGKQVFKEKVEL